jgi:HD superfamily phosphohydrolase YqeK
VTTGVALPSWAVVGEKRAAHIARVAALTQQWAAAMGVPAAEAARWERAAVLHDALRDAAPDVLARYVPRGDWPLKLWHGPAAAAAAQRDGEADQGILDAVRYHSVGFTGWDDCGRIVFLADYLEPGRTYDRAHLDALAARVPRDLAGVVRDVLARRIAHLVTSGNPVRPETMALWNQLAGAASPS